MFFHPLPIQTRLAEVTNSCVAATTGSEASVNRGRSIKLFFNGNTRITLCSQLLTESQRTFVRLNWKWEAWKWIRRMILWGKWRQMPFIKLDFSSLVLEEKGDFSWADGKLCRVSKDCFSLLFLDFSGLYQIIVSLASPLDFGYVVVVRPVRQRQNINRQNEDQARGVQFKPLEASK